MHLIRKNLVSRVTVYGLYCRGSNPGIFLFTKSVSLRSIPRLTTSECGGSCCLVPRFRTLDPYFDTRYMPSSPRV